MLPKQPFFFVLLVSLLYFVALPVKTSNAQEKESKWFVDEAKPVVIKYDTNYFVNYLDDLTTRLYSSVKYTGFRIMNTDVGQNLLYLTNRNLILGFGATYSWFTLNIGLNFPFVNHDSETYGKTKYLDLQTHIYLNSIVADLWLQFERGYYLANSANILSNWPDKDTFQTRPEIQTVNLGYNFQYFFNHEKFTFKAIYNQNAWQKKSAGSWALGTGFFYSINSSDSASLIPSNLENPDLFGGVQFNRKDILNITISGGYYYTLVIAKHFFVSAGLTAGPGFGFTWLDIKDKSAINKSGITPAFTANARFSLGYNSRRIFVGGSILQQSILNQLPDNKQWAYFQMGNARVYFVYRFSLKKPIKLANPNYWKMFNKEE